MQEVTTYRCWWPQVAPRCTPGGVAVAQLYRGRYHGKTYGRGVGGVYLPLFLVQVVRMAIAGALGDGGRRCWLWAVVRMFAWMQHVVDMARAPGCELVRMNG